jgi:hypothetical protein
MASSDAISPTAHYTGWVWWRNGLSHPLLATREGRVLYDVLAPAMRAGSLLGGQGFAVRAFRIVLSAFVRGRVYLHFSDAEDAEARLLEAGFGYASITPAGELADILEVTTS